MKVLHGMSEIAGQGIYSVQGLWENGIDANMAVWVKNPGGYDTDIDLAIDKGKKIMYPIAALKMMGFAGKAMKEYDVIHSHFGYTLLPYNLDIPRLKKKNIKFYAEFHGSDIRFLFTDKEYPYYKSPWTDSRAKAKAGKRIIPVLRNCDGIILHDAELISHIPQWVDKAIYIVPLRVDMKKFIPCYSTDNKRPIIVHAPSNRATKGTDRILDALNKVEEDYDLVLVEGKTQAEAFEIYKQADVIIDQISAGTYGVFAIEAMALGKPVITFISDEMKKTLPDSLPIVSADFDTIADVISDLIKNKEKRIMFGKKGREYVERYHDNVKVTSFLPKIYNGTIENNNLFELL